jgi:excisionase family DNA binding protein
MRTPLERVSRNTSTGTRGGRRARQRKTEEIAERALPPVVQGAVAFGHIPRRRPHQSQINFFTIADVAERLGVSRRTVRRWIAAGDLIAHRIGGIVRIAEGDLRAFLALLREG